LPEAETSESSVEDVDGERFEIRVLGETVWNPLRDNRLLVIGAHEPANRREDSEHAVVVEGEVPRWTHVRCATCSGHCLPTPAHLVETLNIGMAERTETPTDDALADALSALRTEHAALGIGKLHAALLAAHPTWLVSEKRARKVLQTAGLVLAPPAGADALDPAHNGADGGADAPKAASKKKPRKKGGAGAGGAEPGRTYPDSRPTRGLDVAQLAPKVGVQQFGGGKGKGLVATAPIAEGELLWKEDPWAVQAEWCARPSTATRRAR
jgi:hypothetical protein